ncbi:aspartyl protease [Merismopedia glauca]|uniref:Aspartyl protease n=1 Tax=Merismopedia glauca CCAP 1448/3 TaxID=1296344 RepID=A0A2T1C8M1_9CYAN|nr:aspartyl protease [Merismopedia glauca]PSB04591.1 aspartyl protease [Merismopedia glauca CCAP 1448/3]
MIEGRFGDKGQIYFDVDLIDENGLALPVEVILDTGFTEFVAMNKQDIECLDWVFLRQNKLKTAQGEATFDIYLGRVVIDRQMFEIPVFAGEEIQEILLGSQWLKTFTLLANYRESRVTLE